MLERSGLAFVVEVDQLYSNAHSGLGIDVRYPPTSGGNLRAIGQQGYTSRFERFHYAVQIMDAIGHMVQSVTTPSLQSLMMPGIWTGRGQELEHEIIY